MMSLGAYAETRHYEQGEKIYLNVNQSEMNWSSDKANLFLYIYGSNGDYWVKLSRESDNIFVGDMPAGDWDKFIVVRKNNTASTGGWDDKDNIWNRTCNLPFINNPDINCINEFWKKEEWEEENCEGSANWATYAPSLAKIGEFASKETEENIKVCSNALGSSLSLHPKLNSDASNYDYDNVKCHGWYVSTDKSTWSSVDGYDGSTRDGEKEQDASYVLPNSLSSGAIYFYLHSSKKVGRRLIKLTLTDEGCDLDCKITFFGVACSEVNANDTTYTLDGMVAFGVPCGDLVIECDGKSKIIKADTAKSPQIFSIEGLRAATTSGKKTTATAKFLGNEGGKVTAEVDIPNVAQGITYKHIDVLVGETTPLEPTGANYSNKHIWYIDGEEKPEMQGKQTSIPHNESDTTRYAYREFNPPSGSMVNMMSNGNYESEDASVYGGKGDKPSAISEYRFWGQYPKPGEEDKPIDFYWNTNPDVNPSGWTDNGFAVVKNANNFFHTYAKVLPQEGNYFALFDAASGSEMAGKKAWFATTDKDKNKNLKLQKGTTYLFSFWAANINNYGEMDNAAKLQFQINGKDLGKPLDLGSEEFRNNRWHQRSETFTAEEDAETVIISVINLNTNRLYTGNDFALDDIQFRAVSSPTRSVKMQEVFTVQTHEPKIESVSAQNVPMPCGDKEYDIEVTVKYKNPKGQLLIKDVLTGKEYPQDVPAVGNNWEVLQSRTFKIHIDALTAGQQHQFTASFPDYPKAQFPDDTVLDEPIYKACEGIISFTAETLPMDCDSTAYYVKLKVEYVNPDANLIIKDKTTGKNVFDKAVAAGTLNEPQTDSTIIRVADLNDHEFVAYFAGKPEDGISVVATAPQFVRCAEVIKLTADVTDKGCDSTAYDVKLTVEYVNPDGNLIIKDNTTGVNVFDDAVDAGTLNEPQTYSTTIRIDELKNHEFVAYFVGRPEADASAVATAPQFVRCAEVITLTADVIDKGCDSTAYAVKLTVEYVNPDANLVIKDNTTGYNVFDKAVAAGTLNEPQTISTTIRVADLNDHEFIAYLAGNPEEGDTVVATAPEFVRCAEVITLTAEAIEKGCDSTAYDVKLVVEYVNPDGNLVIKDKTTGKNVFDKAVAAGTVNEPQKDSTIIRVAELKDHEFVAYFVGKPEASASVVATAPAFVRCAEVITLTAEVTEKGCDSTAYDVKLIVEYVNPDGNLIIKDKTTGVNVFDKAVAAGMVNESQKDSTTIRVAELKDHEFVAYFVGKPEADATAVAIAPEFEKCCSDGLMYRKWDNVLFINNHDSLYVAFQWYKNDVKLEGETLQRLYTGLVKMAGTTDLYHCELTLADGTKDLTCPHTFDECPSSAEASKLIDEASVSVRPTRVAAGAAVTVSMTTEEAMMATLRTVTGQLIRTAELRDSESTMLMPNNAGVYLLQLQGKETNTTVKIHVY